jgi:kynureninase
VLICESLRDRLQPIFRGYFNPWPSTEIRYGHINYPGLCALEASLLDLESLGWTNIFERVAMLRGSLARNLLDLRAQIITPERDAAGIVSFNADDAQALVARLHANNIRVAVREGLVRVSPHFYNTQREIDRFCDIISSVRKESIS